MTRERTHGASDDELIEIALGYLLIDDGFHEAFAKARGAVDPGVDLSA